MLKHIPNGLSGQATNLLLFHNGREGVVRKVRLPEHANGL